MQSHAWGIAFVGHGQGRFEAMAKRKGISKKVRFEVFKRDSFKCQYCGAEAPDTVLQVDHINPVSKGGTNGLTNLVTSCQPCNAGKSDRTLDDSTAVEKSKRQLDALQERREQLEMMMKWQTETDRKSASEIL